MRIVVVIVALAILAAACSSSTASEPSVSGDPVPDPLLEQVEIELPRGEELDFGTPPDTPDGDLSPEVIAALDVVFGAISGTGLFTPTEATAAIDTLGASGDVRVAWLLTDLLRFVRDRGLTESALAAANELTGLEVELARAWGDVTDHLIAWDVPAPPDYLSHKRELFTLVIPEWEPFFEDGSDVDWRLVSWGGVGIDDRPFDTTDDPCNCIPAADNPEVVVAAEATWEDDDVVFGVEINGESRAYPRRIMEVREMVNDTLGGRDIGMPYCTLCGSAQVYFTDDVPDGFERPVLRTSGLLIRSNKVMYDVNTFSVFDTFLGEAVTGPLAEAGVVLEQAGVVTTTWGDWKAAHPDTSVLIEDLALGRDFDFRSGRDADGPIFPIGQVDPRLPVQADVVGVVTESGTPVAFHVETVVAALEAGTPVTAENIVLQLDGGGIRATDLDGNDVGAHQAFWFAWSQFHPDTLVWPDL